MDGSICVECQGSVTGMIAGVVILCLLALIFSAVSYLYRDYIKENFPLLIAAVFNTGRFKVHCGLYSECIRVC